MHNLIFHFHKELYDLQVTFCNNYIMIRNLCSIVHSNNYTDFHPHFFLVKSKLSLAFTFIFRKKQNILPMTNTSLVND